MDVVIQIVAPVFGIVALGYAAARFGGFDAAAGRGLSLFVFRFALPVALFRALATTEIPSSPPVAFLVTYYLGVALMFVPAFLLGRGGGDRKTIIGFGCAYSNTVLLGIPLIITALGPDASVPLFLLIAFHSPIFFTLVTLLIELSRGAGRSALSILAGLPKTLASNIILMSVASGLIFNVLGLTLPRPLDHMAELLARAAFPGALFSMGAALVAYRLSGALVAASLTVVAKLILHPAIVAVLALLVFRLPDLHAKTAIISAALPVGINVYLFAIRYEVGEAETASAILLSNILSVGTIAVLLMLLDVTPP